jgi:hypothetical protein
VEVCLQAISKPKRRKAVPEGYVSTTRTAKGSSTRVRSKIVGNREDKGDKGDKKDSPSQPTTYDRTHSTTSDRIASEILTMPILQLNITQIHTPPKQNPEPTTFPEPDAEPGPEPITTPTDEPDPAISPEQTPSTLPPELDPEAPSRI